MKRNLLPLLMLPLAMFTLLNISNCKKDKKDDTTDTTGTGNGNGGGTNTTVQYALVIENGAQVIEPGKSLTYKAHLVSTKGETVTPTSVTWTTSNSSVASISGTGAITTVAIGQISITATTTYNSKTYTATAPLGIAAPTVFSVAPAAILYEKGGTIQLESIKLTTSGVSNPSCTYTSSNTAVATVSASGLVTCVAPGSAYITVKAALDGNPFINVPVEVIGAIDIPLPVSKITVSPTSKDLFRGETQTLTAKAFKSSGDEVSGKTFTWTSLDPSIATVSSAGLVTPIKPGDVVIQASVDGIVGQADIIVNPDTMVLITPFVANLAAGATKQFAAQAYIVKRNSATPFTATFDWLIPTYGFSMFDIATVDASGLVTVKSSATVGMTTFVIATIKNNPNAGGASIIMVEVPGMEGIPTFRKK